MVCIRKEKLNFSSLKLIGGDMYQKKTQMYQKLIGDSRGVGFLTM